MTAVLDLLHADPYHNLLRERTAERLRKLVSPTYLKDKLALVAYQRAHPELPWLTRDALALLEAHLRPEHRGFEWGSGNGTLWFARRSESLVSVEHDPEWAAAVQGRLRRAGITNADHRLVPEASYLSVIATFPDETFDYVLVDGLFRDRAFLASIPKLKPGGWLVFDNANWYLPSDSLTPHSRSLADGPETEGFREVAARVATWETRWTTNGVEDTVIFIKPSPGETPSLQRPDVSVVIPTFHREVLVVEAIRSALSQAGVTVEVIVMDDSPDATARAPVLALADPRIRYFHRETPSGGHPAIARNDGLRRARARLVTFLDDDDRLAEGALSALASALSAAPRAGVALGTIRPFGDDPATVRAETAYFERAAAQVRACHTRFDLAACLLYQAAPLISSACMIRRDLALSIDGYNPSMPHLEDGEMYLRAIRKAGFVFVDRPVVHYRTGRPSRIHGATRRSLLEAYRLMHTTYRTTHGPVELHALRLLSWTLHARRALSAKARRVR